MTTSTPSAKSRHNRGSAGGDVRASSRAGRARLQRHHRTRHTRRSNRLLGGYTDRGGRPREVISRPGLAGTMLVVDRDAATLGDRRLVAHLAADEASENAAIVCREYLDAVSVRDCRCRALSAEDLRCVPLPDELPHARWQDAQREHGEGLRGDACAYRLELMPSAMSIPELRWSRQPADSDGYEPISLREVVAALESYEPARTLSRLAVAQHGDDAGCSVTVLRAELERVLDSPIVLNRRLREEVLARVRRAELSMSEIAVRCGRIKRDGKGNESGETSWLARRLGILPEGGHEDPTRWVHSDVLALIARSGLGISPREVEL
jgi:hypothetical protein